MSDEALRQACAKWLDNQYGLRARPDAVESLLRFAKQQQAAGMRMAALDAHENETITEFRARCEARAKELER